MPPEATSTSSSCSTASRSEGGVPESGTGHGRSCAALPPGGSCSSCPAACGKGRCPAPDAPAQAVAPRPVRDNSDFPNEPWCLTKWQVNGVVHPYRTGTSDLFRTFWGSPPTKSATLVEHREQHRRAHLPLAVHQGRVGELTPMSKATCSGRSPLTADVTAAARSSRETRSRRNRISRSGGATSVL
jgi:hypothetical protein